MSLPQYTTDGRRIEVLSLGIHNTDAGPDFTNVHLRIYDDRERVEEWWGNIEIHLYSSDWYKHRHHVDKAYDSVILHVVRKVDKNIYNSQGQTITQCELRYPDEQDYLSQLLVHAHKMDAPLSKHPCGEHLLKDASLLTKGWKQTMLLRRLECKKQSIERLLKLTNNNYEVAFYITLAHSFGFHINGLPFEQLAINTPLSCLNKHRNSLKQLTAILLGQAGLLNETDEIFREYHFLRTKFSLQPIDASMWKMGRIRPQNAPRTRIQQLAQLLYKSDFLFSNMMDLGDLGALRNLLTTDGMGREAIDVLIINAIIPYKYARGKREEAINLLHTMPAEKNNIIRQWKELGQSVSNAADTQALIHLFQTCCQSSHCLNCDVAYQIFLRTAHNKDTE